MSTVESIHGIAKRLKIFIEYVDISVYDFSQSIGDQRSEKVNRVLRALGAPSFDMLQRIKDAYPNINLNWLVNNSGSMLMSSDKFKSLAKQPSSTETPISVPKFMPLEIPSAPAKPSLKVPGFQELSAKGRVVLEFEVKDKEMSPTLNPGDLVKAIKTTAEELSNALNQAPREKPIFPLFQKEKYGPYPIVIVINPPMFDFLISRLVSQDDHGYMTFEGDSIDSSRTRIKPGKAELWAVVEFRKRS